MKILLFHVPKFVERDGRLDAVFANVPAMGLYGLADLLERHGHDARIVHLGVERLLAGRTSMDEIVRQAGGADLAGFSLHWHHQMASTLQAIAEFRAAFPSTPIVVGGMTASVFARELLECAPGIDFVVRGEGEEPLLGLVDALGRDAARSGVANLSYRDGSALRHNPLTFAATTKSWGDLSYARSELLSGAPTFSPRYFFDARTLEPLAYANPRRLFYLETGRGCSRNCVFCGGSATTFRRFFGRSRPAFRAWDAVLADLTRLQTAGYEAVYLSYDPPPISDAYYSVLFNRVFRGSITMQVEFEAFDVHTPVFWEGFANAFGREGSRVIFSPEVADPAMRAKFKGFRLKNEELEANVRHLRALGLTSVLYFTLFPGMTLDDARRMRDWQHELRANYAAEVVTIPIEMEPGSPWHLAPGRYGLQEARRTFDEFLIRHRDVQTVAEAYPAEIGYRLDHLDEMLDLVGRSSVLDRAPSAEPPAP